MLTDQEYSRVRDVIRDQFERGRIDDLAAEALQRIFYALWKDEAPGVGPGASGAEPTGCSPPSPDHRSEDRPRSEVATTPDLESAFRAYAWWLDGD